ncbi:hypothetical protein M409DRAFT_61978 [Zasmidium cellare ATCC 36951]|uniref:Tetratricopeptide SHNi-TPR domain-containing protein n=1 Tax=Zasmidium cellare ATCC 36951 TaxID=1080233 RepID=A0A6A6D3I3_ZASCE|nr:uncharacterized protein M409DRAFT_61978 [Zasmidium cellare ATCC 36951]KAF2173663.1 hypothetical protein M409DRAFT_61978 [Zasmidium cellare ATCC 36951]
MSEPIAEDVPVEQPTAPEDLPAKLDQLKASATHQYSLKKYDKAAEYYSEAAAVQDEINGEMAPENADLLYQYGRCLYRVAVESSDVLGGKVAGEEPKRKKRKVSKAQAESSVAATNGGESAGGLIADAIKDGEQKTAEEMVGAAANEVDGMKPENSSNPFLQITGDENWEHSDEEGEEGEGEPEEEEDDFATAYEILDMARVLLSRKLEAAQNDDGKGKSTEEKPEVRQLKERLADTHDLQAEISLENERFQDAINDTRDALNLKVQLYPEESSLIAEAHYKLSLALEFASVTSTEETPDGDSKVAQVDEDMRKEAANEMELAIASCKARVTKEEARLASLDAAKAADNKSAIAEVKDMIIDMEQRLEDLRKPAVSLSAMQPAGAPGSDEEALRGVLGSLIGESKGEQAKRLAEATQNANDLSSMVKKKKSKQEAAPVEEGKGKRKAEEVVEGAANGKKVKFSSEAEADA